MRRYDRSVLPTSLDFTHSKNYIYMYRFKKGLLVNRAQTEPSVSPKTLLEAIQQKVMFEMDRISSAHPSLERQPSQWQKMFDEDHLMKVDEVNGW